MDSSISSGDPPGDDSEIDESSGARGIPDEECATTAADLELAVWRAAKFT